MNAARFNITTPSAFAVRRNIAEITKPIIGPSDPAPDLTLQVAHNLARNEHPRKQWRDYTYIQQLTYLDNAQFLIVNILRFTREFGYGAS